LIRKALQTTPPALHPTTVKMQSKTPLLQTIRLPVQPSGVPMQITRFPLHKTGAGRQKTGQLPHTAQKIEQRSRAFLQSIAPALHTTRTQKHTTSNPQQ